MKCNLDCFNCVYDDCVMETTRRDALLSHEIEEALRPSQRAGDQASDPNLRNIADDREKVRKRQMDSYYRHWDAAQKRTAEYRQRNIEQYAEEQKCIKEARKRRGATQQQVADLLGVTKYMISSWERGALKAKWELVYAVFPELEGR